MKTFIISDINEDIHSVITYGLNIGKHTETRVEILHYIDPHEKQGTPSPYADSHTVSPGEKLSYEEILNKRRSRAATFLDRLLSKEASRLNYPLRYSQTIEVLNVQEAIKEKLAEEPGSILVTGTKPSSDTASSLADLLILLRDIDDPILIVPAEQRFLRPVEGIMITDFSEEDADKLNSFSDWFKPFHVKIAAFSIGQVHNTENKSEKEKHWVSLIHQQEGQPVVNKTGHLEGKDPIKVLHDHVQKTKPDFVVLPKNRKVFADYLYAGKHSKQLVDALGKPVLLY